MSREMNKQVHDLIIKTAHREDVKDLRNLAKQVSVRETHPTLYRVLMIIAIMFIALAVNLYFGKPTFNPYGLSKEVVGLVFLVLGVSKIVFLNLYHNLRLVRLIMAVSAAFMMFWGVSNSQQSFAGKASFQLPILYVTLAILNLFLLVEPASNPVSSTNGIKQK